MRTSDDAAKDPSQLEREVDEQRREITNTIHQLEEKFSSREMYNQAANYVRDHGGEFAENLGNSLKANPLPVMLTSVGLLWMMVGQRNPSGYRSQSHDSANDMFGNNTSVYGHEGEAGRMDKMKAKGSQLKEKAGSARERASGFKQRASASSHDIRDKAAATREQLRESASHARDGFGRSVGSARSNFEHYLEEQPLALGAIGIALGAMIGASLPRSQAENRAIGDISERARHKASEMAEKGYQKANEMGESVRRQAQDSLDPEHRAGQQPSPTSPKGQGPTPTP